MDAAACWCTFAVFNETFEEQPFYECISCGFTLEKGTAVCGGCVRSCHAECRTHLLGRIRAYCDCGGGGGGSCKLVAAGAPADAELARWSEVNASSSGELDARLSIPYGEPGYWEERYRMNQTAGEEDEWLLSFDAVRAPLEAELRSVAPGDDETAARLFVTGAGDSPFSADLCDAGFVDVTSGDIAEVSVQAMRVKYAESHPALKWLVEVSWSSCWSCWSSSLSWRCLCLRMR